MIEGKILWDKTEVIISLSTVHNKQHDKKMTGYVRDERDGGQGCLYTHSLACCFYSKNSLNIPKKRYIKFVNCVNNKEIKMSWHSVKVTFTKGIYDCMNTDNEELTIFFVIQNIDDTGNLKNSEKNLCQCCFIHHKSHMDRLGLKSRTLQ
jgi:hypothetical protein